MEKKQLLNNNNGFVGFYPNIHIPFYQLQINIGSYESEEEFNIEETINLDDTFIDIYNKCEEGQNTTIRLDIISDTLESGSTTPIFNGYKGNNSLYFQSNTIINSGKDNENTLIRNLKITNIDVIAKTANINFVQKSVNNSSLTHLLQGGIFHVDDYNENESFAVENIPITLEDSFINTFNKLNIGDFCSLSANIKYKNIILLFRRDNADYIGVKYSYNSCRFNGYVCNFGSNDNYLIDIWITNINTTDKTATLNIAQKIINLISSGDGNKYLSDDGTYKSIEVGDKTNVLILSLENDLANGQKDSPVDAEVSTALKDAISTGKACVIKSANSDILANLQQTGDNVTIIMEQISRVGQTFVAVNTTITVNTVTNVISDYQTGAIVLETEGDGSKFLSNDGSYKDVSSSSVIIPVDLVLNKVSSSDSSGYDFSEIWEAYNSGKTVYLKDSQGLHYLVINIATNGISYFAVNTEGTYSGKPELYWFYNVNYGGAIGTIYRIEIIGRSDNILYKDNSSYYIPTYDYNPATKKYVDEHSADMSNYLAKDNATEFTPTGDYNPATKKYVDDRTPKPFLNIASLLSAVRTAGIKTQVDVTNEMVSLFGSIANFKSNYANQVYLNNSAPVTLNTNLDAKNEFMFVAVYGGSGLEENNEQNIDNNAFKLYYYNFKINDDNTVVTGYYNTTDIIRDPDRPNEYLSADGTYKYPYSAGIYFSEHRDPTVGRYYWENYIIEKQNNNGNCTLVLISDCSKIYDGTSTTDILTNTVFGIGGYGILNRIANNSFPYSRPIFIEAIIGLDDESNYKVRLHTSDWMIFPCIVKYQNKYYVAIRFGNITTPELVVMGSYLNIIGQSSNLLDSFIYLNCEKGQLYPTGVEVINRGTYFDKDNLRCDRDNLLAKTNADGYMSKEDKTKLDNTPVQKILTESEYAALGTTPETDGVLYFVTPD